MKTEDHMLLIIVTFFLLGAILIASSRVAQVADAIDRNTAACTPVGDPAAGGASDGE